MFTLALLIDAENISYRDLPIVLEHVERLGRVTLTAIYADWERRDMQKWRVIAETNNFKLRHQTNDPNAKNAADMRLIMDAMDILHHIAVDAFCLVTNDADYVPLCDKLREADKHIIGIGYLNAANALIRACDHFVFIRRDAMHKTPHVSVGDNRKNAKQSTPSPLDALIIRAFEKTPRGFGKWVRLSTLGAALRKVDSKFDTTTYGHKKLSALLNSLPHLVETRKEGTVASARLKPQDGNHSFDWDFHHLLKRAFESVAYHDDGWVTLSALGLALRQVQNGFKPKHYGAQKLSSLLKKMPDAVEIRTKNSVMYARLRSDS